MAGARIDYQELESLPEVVASYAPDTLTLSIHNGLKTSDGEEIARGLSVFYDAEGCPAGFVLELGFAESAASLLRPLVDFARSKSQGGNTFP